MNTATLLFVIKVALLVYIAITLASPVQAILEMAQHPFVRVIVLLIAVVVATIDVPLALLICAALLTSIVSLLSMKHAANKPPAARVVSAPPPAQQPPSNPPETTSESQQGREMPSGDGGFMPKTREALLSSQPAYENQGSVDSARAFDQDSSMYASVECGQALDAIYSEREKLIRQWDDDIKKITFVSPQQLAASQSNQLD